MKFRHVFSAFACAVAICLGFQYLNEKPTPRSPKQIYPVHTQTAETRGSGHAFGYNVVYTIASHTMHKGKAHVIVTSAERGVEIWSPVPSLVAMENGSKFLLTDKGNTSFDEALKRIR